MILDYLDKSLIKPLDELTETRRDFPWFFIKDSVGYGKKSFPVFTHLIYEKDRKVNSTPELFDYVLNILNTICNKHNIEYKFIGLFPRDLSSVPVKYEGSEILKASVRFSYDRYVCGRHDSYSLNRGNDDNKEETSENKSSGATFVPAKHGSGVGYRRIEDRNNPNSPIYYDKDFTRPVP